MAESDGYAQYSPTAEDAMQFFLSPDIEKKTVENMKKHLSKEETLDKMREYMENLLKEDGWEERLKQDMKQVVDKSDLSNTHYITMLQQLGKLEVGATASTYNEDTEVDVVVDQLIEQPQFAIKPKIEENLFKMWSVLYADEIKDAYNSSCPGT